MFYKNYSIKILFSTLLVFTFNACNYSIEKEQKHSKKEQQKSININKEEAQLLVKIAKTNSEIITLSNEAKNKDGKIKTIAKSLERNHKLIAKALHKIAEKKLILIPETTYSNEIEIEKAKNKTNFSVAYLQIISKLLENQIKTLNKLRDETLDKDFIILSVNTNAQLKAHLNSTETYLNKF